MSSVRLDPSLARVLKLPPDTQSPEAIVVAMFKQQAGLLRTLQNRAAHRCSLTTIKIHDGDPNKSGDQAAFIDVRVGVGDGVGEQAMRFAALFLHSPASAMALGDEAARMMTGQPEGPPVRALDQPLESQVDATTLAILAPSARGFFGIDDAIILGVGIPLLCALIPVVIPMLVQLGASAIDMVMNTVEGRDVNTDRHAPGFTPGPANAAPKAPAAQDFGVGDEIADQIGIGSSTSDDSMTGYLVLAAAGVAIWFFLRKRG